MCLTNCNWLLGKGLPIRQNSRYAAGGFFARQASITVDMGTSSIPAILRQL